MIEKKLLTKLILGLSIFLGTIFFQPALANAQCSTTTEGSCINGFTCVCGQIEESDGSMHTYCYRDSTRPCSDSDGSIQLNLGQEAIEKELPGSASSEEGNQAAGFSYWLGRAMSLILIVAALLVLVNLFMGAIKWISSGGDSGKLSEAQKQITNSIIGLIVLAAVVAIFQLLTDFLKLDFIRFI